MAKTPVAKILDTITQVSQMRDQLDIVTDAIERLMLRMEAAESDLKGLRSERRR